RHHRDLVSFPTRRSSDLDGVAGPGSGDHGRKGTVTAGGFGEVTAAGSGGPRVRAEAKPQETPVEIQFKPRPIYTEEARKLHVERSEEHTSELQSRENLVC